MANRFRDGIRKIGPGKWEARIVARKNGVKILDTTRIIYADTRLEALKKRDAIRAELLGAGEEWTVDEALDAWMPTLRAGTLHARKTHAKRIRAAFGSLKLSLVPPADVQRWLAKLPGIDDTANYHRATLQALYRFARERGRLVGDNPIEQTQPRRTPKSSAELLAELEAPAARKALGADELPRFFAALEQLSPDLYPVMRAQLMLGCRWSEATALKWGDVDWTTGVVTIRRGQSRKGELGPPKGKAKRYAALGAEGLAFLRGHRAQMERAGWLGWETWVFPRPPTHRHRPCDTWGYETTRRRVHDAMKAAGLDLAAVTHAMRHTHITMARGLESDLALRASAGDALRASVGHSDERMTETYTDDSHRKAVAQSFASQLESRLGGGSSGGAHVIQISKSFKKTR